MKIDICMCAKCTMRGANSIYDAVEFIENNMLKQSDTYDGEEAIEVELSSRLDACKKLSNISVSPVVTVDDEIIYMATAREISEKIINKLLRD